MQWNFLEENLSKRWRLESEAALLAETAGLGSSILSTPVVARDLSTLAFVASIHIRSIQSEYDRHLKSADLFC